ncbi:LPS-assembly protein LptD [Marinicella rhabdoformis]|uniref:LPS-assembly protein LptD n=1 Tax=Marinicella rhabdoformis TaxID=2580566 RepID=UPI0012AED84D|nr:LPS assembly protein LptD [Marinicella rhabdoformis]
MKKLALSFLSCLSLTVLSGVVSAQLQCEFNDINLSDVQTRCLEQPSSSSNIEVNSSNAKKISDKQFLLSGNVCIKRDQLRFMTPQLSFDKATQRFKTDGGVWLQNDSQRIMAKDAEMDNQNKSAKIKHLSYFMLDSDMNGKADQMELSGDLAFVENMTFSTCSPDQRSWEIVAKEAHLDNEEGMGTFKGARLKIKDKTVLYIPWIKLPLNGDRRSGLLMPAFSYSNTTGVDLSVPYYFNINPQYDLTLIPRYLQDHGMMLGTEFRYLGKRSAGVLEGTYLPNDDKRGNDRGLFQYKHRTQINSAWRFSTDLNHVSDSQYYEDFSSSSFLTSTPYLKSQVSIQGHANSWQFFAGFNDYQVLSQNITAANEPYQKLPEVRFSWYKPASTTGFDYGIDSELVNFYREDAVGAWRTELKPWVSTEFSNTWGSIKPKLVYRSTHYSFDDNREGISRSLPIFSLDSGLTFEKWADSGTYKTIEPRLFYVYVPEKNQDDIPVFDSRLLTFGSNMLFQTNRFSGSDRQADMNQAALAITHRSFAASGEERWNLTLGQINYFDDQLVQLSGTPQDLTKSPFIAEYNLYLHNNWSAGVSLHYDQDSKDFERGLFKLQRKSSRGDVFNFAYRYRQNKIEQIDTSAVIPIKDSHRLLTRVNYSLKSHKTIEALFGYEYKGCCWALRLMGRHHLVDETGLSNNGFYVEFQLNGLGALGRNPRRLLKQSILGYEEAF